MGDDRQARTRSKRQHAGAHGTRVPPARIAPALPGSRGFDASRGTKLHRWCLGAACDQRAYARTGEGDGGVALPRGRPRAPKSVHAIWANGPDGDNDGGHVVYDVTNGIESDGDIVQFELK